MKRIKILYLFRRPVGKNMKAAATGNFPHDYFFGYTKLGSTFAKKVSDKVFTNKLILAAEWQLQKIIRPVTKVGFSIISVMRQLDLIAKSQVIFATVDSYGLPLSLLKVFRIVKKPLIIYTGGLCDELVFSRSKLFVKIVQILLSKANFIISGNQYECQKMAKLLHLPEDKFKFVPYGIDTSYFTPSIENRVGDYILAIGADPKRDWDLHKKIASSFPRVKFIFVTDQLLSGMPKNVKLLYNIPIGQVKDYMRNSAFVIIFSKQNSRFAGQSTIFRSMACGKPVVFTKSYGVEDYPGLANFQNCIMVPPGNFKVAQKAVRFFTGDKKRIKIMGQKAREFIIKYANYKDYTKKLEQIFKKSLTAGNL